MGNRRERLGCVNERARLGNRPSISPPNRDQPHDCDSLHNISIFSVAHFRVSTTHPPLSTGVTYFVFFLFPSLTPTPVSCGRPPNTPQCGLALFDLKKVA